MISNFLVGPSMLVSYSDSMRRQNFSDETKPKFFLEDQNNISHLWPKTFRLISEKFSITVKKFLF